MFSLPDAFYKINYKFLHFTFRIYYFTFFKRTLLILNKKETGVRLLPFYPNKTLNQQNLYSLTVPSSLISNSFEVLSGFIIFTL